MSGRDTYSTWTTRMGEDFEPRPEEPAQQLPTPGTLVGPDNRFEILSSLGRGAMGHVYKALDHELSRYVAIKFLSPRPGVPVADRVAILRAEARSAARLSQPNIVAVYDIGVWNELPFLVMEHLRGRSLHEALAEGPLETEAAIDIAMDVLEGLRHAHAMGVVHRDMKPSNIFLCQDGRVAILDFGIAGIDAEAVGLSRYEGHAEDEDGTRSVPRAGTPNYMAPEQWAGKAQDRRVDLWSVSVILYEMVVGESLLTGATIGEKRREVLGNRPLLRRLEQVPPALIRVLGRGLERDPALRFGSATEFQEALRGVDRARGGGPSGEVDRRQVTFLAASLVSGTEPVPFAVAAAAIGSWQNACQAVLRRQRGAVVNLTGPSLLAAFGYPYSGDDDAQRAAHAATELQSLAARSGSGAMPALALQIGLDTGLTVTEELPDGLGRTLPLLEGPAVEQAIGLRRAARPGGILLTDRTRSLLARSWSTTAAGVVDGFTEVYELGEPHQQSARFYLAAAPTSMIGREAELDLAATLWRAAAESRGSLLLLIGEAGIGKSRLASVLTHSAIRDHHLVLQAQCWPETRRTPFHAVLQVIPAAWRLSAAPSGGLRARLEEIGLDPPAARRVAWLVGGPEEAPAPETTASPVAERRATIEALLWLLEHAAERDGPILLLVEDLHWIDASSEEILVQLAGRLGALRLLVVGTARPEYQPPTVEGAPIEVRRMAPLDMAAGRALVDAMIGAAPTAPPTLDAEEISRLVARSGGVPLFLEELTRMAMHEGGEARDTLPPTVHALIRSRLGRLSPDGRTVLEAGAVLGRWFLVSAVRRMLDASGCDVDAGIAEILAEEFAHGADDLLQFRHALVADTVQECIPPARLRALSASALAALRDIADPPPPEALAELAEEAELYPGALQLWELAGSRAAAGWAVSEAIDHFQRALGVLENLPEDAARRQAELRLLLALGPPLMAARGYAAPQLAMTYSRAYTLSLVEGAQAQLFTPLVGLWQFNMVGGNLPESRVMGERLMAIAEATADPTHLILARRALGTSLFLQGYLQEALAELEAGWRLYDWDLHSGLARKHGNDPGVGHGVYLAWALVLAGKPDRAAAQAKATRDLAERLQHPLSVAFSHCYSAIVENLRGDHATALALSRVGSAVSAQHGLALWAAFNRVMEGWALACLGDSTQGIPLLEQGIAEWGRTGARAGTTFFFVALAEAQLDTGDLETAKASLVRADELQNQNRETFHDPELSRVRARVARAEGRFEDAVGLLRKGLVLASTRGAWGWAYRIAAELQDMAAAGQADREEARVAVEGADAHVEGSFVLR